MKKTFISLLSVLLMNLSTENLVAQNVGIGTVTPTEKLEIKNPLKSTVKISAGSLSDTTQLIFSNKGSTAGLYTDFSIKSIRENGLFFSSQSDVPVYNSANSLVILPEGNVGIGLIPAFKLDVNGDINTKGLLRLNGASGAVGQVLTSNGTAAPTWQATTNPQIGFAARGTAPAVSNHQDIPNNVDTKVTIFNVEEIDNGNLYNPATARATVPSDGLYHIDISVHYGTAQAGVYQLFFRRLSPSGTDLGVQRLAWRTVTGAGANEEFQLDISADIHLLANQSIEIFTNQNTGAVQQITGSFYSWFNMHKVY